jgi:hypothetical protein
MRRLKVLINKNRIMILNRIRVRVNSVREQFII